MNNHKTKVSAFFKSTTHEFNTPVKIRVKQDTFEMGKNSALSAKDFERNKNIIDKYENNVFLREGGLLLLSRFYESLEKISITYYKNK